MMLIKIDRRTASIGVFAVTLLVGAVLWFGCITGYLEEGNKKIQSQIDEQSAQIAQTRKDIEELRAGQTSADRKKAECSRAFRDYFDKAQLATNREQAISLYRQGLDICPDDDVAHYELGRALADAGRFGEAEKSFEAALRINPDFTDARRQLESIRKTR